MYFDYVQAIFSIGSLLYVVFTWCDNESKSVLSVQRHITVVGKKKRLLQFDQSLLTDCFALPAFCDESSTFGSYKKLCWKIQDFHML